MKPLYLLCFLLLLSACTQKASRAPLVITEDITRFWTAYDQIVATQDSARQRELLSQLYLNPGSPGLQAFRERKGYTAEAYLEAINGYPRFWESVRENTLRSGEFAEEIEAGIVRLRKLYPELKPATIYFTIGGLMSGGTTVDSLVLIGAESAMADSSVITEELPDWLGQNLRRYFDTNPIEEVVLLNLHEYVHTQQNTYGYDLLSQSLFEGVAEFVSVKAMETTSSTPAVRYGETHEAAVKTRFGKEMFSPNWDDWLYNNFDNEFEVRDLGYFVGYAIAEAHYEKATDKAQAIREMIELDYGSRDVVENFVQGTGYFAESMEHLREAFDSLRPKVVAIRPFANASQTVDPSLTQLVIEFSEPMNPRFRGFEYGPLGEDQVLSVKAFDGFSPDGKSVTLSIKLEAGERYQLELSAAFRSLEGRPLQPYLIDIRTRE